MLTSNDPKYKEKLATVLDTLHSVKENEAFFFVDEMGPYRVKKYGGKALVEKGKSSTVPEFQKNKGSIHAVAALEAYTNQLTWRFIEHKDANAIISLFEQLKEKYRKKKQLYVTWDSISTHDAGLIHEWIEEVNQRADKQGHGVRFVIVPLPSRSQFLNVIESVFGGMKRAVIHNSDYPSKQAMITAVDQHFVDRNAYFEKNPKRVGKKIWDREAFDLRRLEGGLFKKM
ncbi:MAG: transposase [Desulfobulbaceae bacterium]|nr:transposase [Desulfobulbaceae bacterium]